MRAAVSRGYQVIEINSAEHPPAEREETLRLLLNRRVDGVILGWPRSDLEVRRILDHGLPAVQVMKPRLAEGSSTITVDSSPGIDAAVNHLVALGHERIAYLGNNDPHPIEYARLDRFVTSLERHGIQACEEYVKLGDLSLAESRELTHALLSLPEPPTAMLMVDSSVLGGLRALYERRLRLPDDVNVVSTDDMLASHLYPPLTSIVQPLKEVAESAVTLIEERVSGLKDDDEEPSHIVLPTHMEVRSSTNELR